VKDWKRALAARFQVAPDFFFPGWLAEWKPAQGTSGFGSHPAVLVFFIIFIN
jgi:hypothetical protein